jgi:hypothetical protein
VEVLEKPFVVYFVELANEVVVGGKNIINLSAIEVSICKRFEELVD